MDQAELIAKTVNPATPKHSYVSIRSFPTEQERNFAYGQLPRGWPHLRPRSVLIAAMGYHWAPTAWNKVIDMLLETQKQGIYVALQEIQDRCMNPYDALGTMRNEAILEAEAEGFEYLCYVDNDVLPKPDTLNRLLAWDMPVVAPLVLEPGTGKQLSGPAVQPNTGLHPAKWAVLSMLLFRVNALRSFNGMFWSDAIGADEGFHFQRLWAAAGHRPYLDSNTQLVVAGEPLYPLAANRFSPEEQVKFWQAKKDKLLRPPDRRAVDPFGPGVVEGDYMPFAVAAEAGTVPGSKLLAPANPVGWGEKRAVPAVKVEEVHRGWGQKRDIGVLQLPWDGEAAGPAATGGNPSRGWAARNPA